VVFYKPISLKSQIINILKFSSEAVAFVKSNRTTYPQSFYMANEFWIHIDNTTKKGLLPGVSVGSLVLAFS
jgi:hypothetical protein